MKKFAFAAATLFALVAVAFLSRSQAEPRPGTSVAMKWRSYHPTTISGDNPSAVLAGDQLWDIRWKFVSIPSLQPPGPPYEVTVGYKLEYLIIDGDPTQEESHWETKVYWIGDSQSGGNTSSFDLVIDFLLPFPSTGNLQGYAEARIIAYSWYWTATFDNPPIYTDHQLEDQVRTFTVYDNVIP